MPFEQTVAAVPANGAPAVSVTISPSDIDHYVSTELPRLNRFIDRIRSHRRAVERERPLMSDEVGQVADARGASASQVEQAEDLWRRMLELCPPPHRELLRMKRQGLPNSEIAARTGLNPGSVRRILAQLASRLAREGQGGA